MVHEAMVLEYSGRHLAMIELAAALKLLLYLSLIACIFVPWGLAPRRRRPRRLRHRRSRPTLAKLALGGFLLVAVRDLDRQDAGVPRAAIPGRRPDAGPARHAPAVRVAELLMSAASLRHRAPAGRRPGAGELHAALPGPPVRRCSTSSRCTPWCCRPSVAWQAYIQDAPHLYVTAAIALVLQGASSSRWRCAASSCGSASTARSRRWSASARPCWPAWASSRCRWWSCSRSPPAADPLAREDLAFALSVVLLGPADDGDAAQRGEPGRSASCRWRTA